MKTCNDCKQELPLDRFHKNNAKPDKLNIYCKTCVSKRNLKFYENHPGYTREYYLVNKIRIQERIETWQKAHKTKVRKYQKEYYAKNRIEIDCKRRELNALRKRKNVG